jgi:hypothetical protein
MPVGDGTSDDSVALGVEEALAGKGGEFLKTKPLAGRLKAKRFLRYVLVVYLKYEFS